MYKSGFNIVHTSHFNTNFQALLVPDITSFNIFKGKKVILILDKANKRHFALKDNHKVMLILKSPLINIS